MVGGGAPVLVRPRGAGWGRAVDLDADQRAVVDHRPGAGPLVVLGAPGTGRTTAVLELLAARVERHGADPASLLVLAPSRTAAGALRDRVSARLGTTSSGALARTPSAYAFGVLRRAALLADAPLPRLLSGPEQDHLIADLLRGHEAGDAPMPPWPATVPRETRALRAFRGELRDVMMRAMERGLGPDGLARAGRAAGRAEWVAVAHVLREYREVLALASPGAHDPAAVLLDAARALVADPGLLGEERARLSLVAVEDHHESTAAVAALLDLVAGAGAPLGAARPGHGAGPDLVVVGDPDATTAGFRGGDPALLAGAARRHRRADGSAAPTVVLGTRWRAGAGLSAPAAALAERIGAAGTVAHRRPEPSPSAGPGSLETHVLRSPGAQGAFVAGLLRAEHLQRGTPWGSMAVVVRSTRAARALRRALAAAGVPVAVPVAEVPVREESAVRPLRTAMHLVLSDPRPGADGQDGAPDDDRPGLAGPLPAPGLEAVEDATSLLGSWLGGADALALRRLRLALLAADRAAGGACSSDALLVAALGRPALLDALPGRAARPARAVARVLAAGREAAVPGASAEEVLWALWESAGVAAAWQRAALGGGPAAARADRDLDAVTALFDAAARYEDRLPGSPPARFLEHLESQDVPSDTLAEQRPDTDAVDLLTAQGAVGREWDVVVVPGLVQGAWPDTRLRGTLLGAPDLADLVDGRAPAGAPPAEAAAAARRQVLDDERRLLHVALTRARRRAVLTAVDDGQDRPSVFLDVVAPREDPAPRPLTAVGRVPTLPALVAELRSVLVGPDSGTGAGTGADPRPAAAAALARLAAAGVAGADPSQWHGLVPLSDDAPLVDDGRPVRVSPSAVETVTTCALRWVLGTRTGGSPPSVGQQVGTLVHRVAQDVGDGDEAAMTARLDQLWPTLGLRQGWVGDRELLRARTMIGKLAAYVAHARASGRTVAGVEVAVEATLGRALVRGRLDRVERESDGRLRVVDFKTGRRSPSRAEVTSHAQLGTYQALVEAGALDAGALDAGGDDAGDAADGGSDGTTGGTVPTASAGAALVQLGTPSVRFAEQSQEALSQAPEPSWARTLVEDAATAMAASAFTAVENDQCPSCPVRTSCPLQGGGAP